MLAYITKPPTNRKQTITANNFTFFSSYFFCTLYSLLCVLWYTEYKNRKISCKAIHTKVTTIVDAQRISNTCCVARTYLNSWQLKKPGHNQQDVLSSLCEQNVNLVFELYVWIRSETVQFIMRIVYRAVARATSATYEYVMQSTHFISQAIQKKTPATITSSNSWFSRLNQFLYFEFFGGSRMAHENGKEKQLVCFTHYFNIWWCTNESPQIIAILLTPTVMLPKTHCMHIFFQFSPRFIPYFSLQITSSCKLSLTLPLFHSCILP